MRGVQNPNQHEQRTAQWHITIRMSKIQSEEALKAIGEKYQVTYKGRNIRILSNFSSAPLSPGSIKCNIYPSPENK